MQSAINCVREYVNIYTPSQLDQRGHLTPGYAIFIDLDTATSHRISAHCICYVIKIQPSKYPYSLIHLSSNICAKKLVLRVSEIFIHRGATLGFFGQYHTIFLKWSFEPDSSVTGKLPEFIVTGIFQFLPVFTVTYIKPENVAIQNRKSSS